LQEAPPDPPPWGTGRLASVDELRPAAPADPASSEMDELLDYQRRRTDETAAIVTKWGSRPAVIPWVEMGLDLAGEFGYSGPRTSRAQALLRTALYDTVLATLDAQGAEAAEPPPAPGRGRRARFCPPSSRTRSRAASRPLSRKPRPLASGLAPTTRATSRP